MHHPATHEEALEWAQRARETQASILEGLSAGALDLTQVLERASAEELVGRIRVLPVLESLPGAGKVATRRTLATLGIDETTPLAQLDAAPVIAAFGASA